MQSISFSYLLHFSLFLSVSYTVFLNNKDFAPYHARKCMDFLAKADLYKHNYYTVKYIKIQAFHITIY